MGKARGKGGEGRARMDHEVAIDPDIRGINKGRLGCEDSRDRTEKNDPDKQGKR